MKMNCILIIAVVLPLSLSTSACKRKSDAGDKTRNAFVMLVGNKDRGWLGVSVESHCMFPPLAPVPHRHGPNLARH